jgi:hypothetical protein
MYENEKKKINGSFYSFFYLIWKMKKNLRWWSMGNFSSNVKGQTKRPIWWKNIDWLKLLKFY